MWCLIVSIPDLCSLSYLRKFVSQFIIEVKIIEKEMLLKNCIFYKPVVASGIAFDIVFDMH